MSEMQQAAVAAKKSKMSVRDICYAGLFAAVIAVMAQIAREAKETPELVKSAPHQTPIGRLNETQAARNPVLRYQG